MLKIDELITRSRSAKNLSLDEAQSKQIIARYHIPVVQEITASTQKQALEAAKNIGYPVV
ncbi:MAG: acetate--CoA ligase family protein, partial [Proteobacteria bacterium]|nr:acetate--CoA ligase family protein [Pseudomonadota bacterium]